MASFWPSFHFCLRMYRRSIAFQPIPMVVVNGDSITYFQLGNYVRKSGCSSKTIWVMFMMAMIAQVQ